MCEFEGLEVYLPTTMKEVVQVIGLPAATVLARSRGGTGVYLTKHGMDYQKMVEAIGEELAVKLTAYFNRDYIYLPKCEVALRVLRNRAFYAEFVRLTGEGLSGRRAMVELCRQYRLSDRQGWDIVYSFRRKPEHRQAMLF